MIKNYGRRERGGIPYASGQEGGTPVCGNVHAGFSFPSQRSILITYPKEKFLSIAVPHYPKNLK